MARIACYGLPQRQMLTRSPKFNPDWVEKTKPRNEKPASQ